MGKLIIIYGTENKLINENLEKITNKLKNSEIVEINYNDNMPEIINAISMPSLFNESKLVIIKNTLFLSGSKSLDEKYLEMFNTIKDNKINVVMTLEKETIDKRKKITKLADKIIECNLGSVNVNQWVRDYVNSQNKQIDNDAINDLVYLIGKDLNSLQNELDKLILFYENNITKEEINKLVPKRTEETIWDLINAIYDNDKGTIFDLVNGLLDQKEDPIMIYTTIANGFRFILQVYLLQEQNKPQTEIASILGAHPFRVKKAMEHSRRYNEETIREVLHDLYKLDVSVKSGELDKEIALKNWLINV